VAEPNILVFERSTEVSTGVIQTEGDIHIVFTHWCMWTYSDWIPIKIISGRKLMPTV